MKSCYAFESISRKEKKNQQIIKPKKKEGKKNMKHTIRHRPVAADLLFRRWKFTFFSLSFKITFSDEKKKKKRWRLKRIQDYANHFRFLIFFFLIILSIFFFFFAFRSWSKGYNCQIFEQHQEEWGHMNPVTRLVRWLRAEVFLASKLGLG